MREAGPCGACAVLCSRQRGQTSPELAHFCLGTGCVAPTRQRAGPQCECAAEVRA